MMNLEIEIDKPLSLAWTVEGVWELFVHFENEVSYQKSPATLAIIWIEFRISSLSKLVSKDHPTVKLQFEMPDPIYLYHTNEKEKERFVE